MSAVTPLSEARRQAEEALARWDRNHGTQDFLDAGDALRALLAALPAEGEGRTVPAGVLTRLERAERVLRRIREVTNDSGIGPAAAAWNLADAYLARAAVDNPAPAPAVRPLDSLPLPTAAVLYRVAAERERQNVKWNRTPGVWPDDTGVKLAVLTEEVGEVARCLLERGALSDLKAELVQVAAVAVAWAEAIDTALGDAG